MECEYNIRCGELVSDSIHFHNCDDNYDGADNDDRGGWGDNDDRGGGGYDDIRGGGESVGAVI